MRAFSGYNPAVTAVYFLAAAGIAMFTLHPVLLASAMLGALSYRAGRHPGRLLLLMLLFLVTAAVNPIVSQNGVTVLFFLGNRAFTAEACFYGLASAAMIVSVLGRFLAFTDIMTADRLLYVLSRLSPRMALILSMAMRYVPLFSRQAAKIRDTQTAMGLYKEDTLTGRVRGGVRIFSVMMTWALENGIVTADSMAARGYGTGRRTSFSPIRFRASDGVLLALILGLSAVTVTAMARGALDFVYYPAVRWAEPSLLTVLGTAAYVLLSFLPILTDWEAHLRWNFCMSKI